MHSVAPAKPAPKPKPAGERKPDDPVHSVPLSGLKEVSLGSLGAVFSELRVRTPEGKEKEAKIGKRGAKDDREVKHGGLEDVPSGKKRSESVPGSTKHPPKSSPIATTLPATHPAASSPTTTPPVAEGTGLTGVPDSTHGVNPSATGLPMAHPVP